MRGLSRAAQLLAPLALLLAQPAEGSAKRRSESIGHPERGTLRGGCALPVAGRYHKVQPFTVRHDLVWGTCRLVAGILAVARVLDEPRSRPLMIGNLSQRGGGEMPHSASHESGRDVDLALPMANDVGRPIFSYYHHIGPDLVSRSHGARYRFDVKRSWALVRALLETEAFEVERIVIAPYLRTAMLEHAAASGAAPGLIERARLRIIPPWPGVVLHDNHMHVRIACEPSAEPRCVEARWPSDVAGRGRSGRGGG